jgi:3-dehydroquinate synthase
MQKIIRSEDITSDLSALLNKLNYNGLYVLTDEHTERLCLPRLETIPEIEEAKKFTIPSGDEHKNIEALSSVWQFLSENGANRRSLLINVGGGMLTDLGGFAAATFKRGVRFVNIPTTLLGAVDAAVGGKTGINFNGLKNEIGAFCPAEAVLIDALFFKTLDLTNLLSGYAELLKHALIDEKKHNLGKILTFDFETIDYETLNSLLFESVLIKEHIVSIDPTEQGLRKALNLGHTVGHAFESLSHERQRPVPHGFAVAWGLVCELYLSFLMLGFDRAVLSKVTRFVKDNYDRFDFRCDDYGHLIELMQHDKKNENGQINFTLLRGVGQIEINQTTGHAEIEEALDYLRES